MRPLQDVAPPRSKRLARWVAVTALTAALAVVPARDAAHAADPATGTVPPWLRPETRLRLASLQPSGSRPIVGEFLEARGDSIWIRDRYSRRDTGLPLSNIALFEVSRERSPRTWTGAGIGFLAGALLGGAAGASEGADQGDSAVRIVVGGILYGSLGMIVGAIVGHAVQSDHWSVIWNREADSR